MTKRIALAIGALLLLPTTVAAQESPPQTFRQLAQKSLGQPRATVDGKKNPELVPEYAAWMAAFHDMCASPGDDKATCSSMDTDLPSVIVHTDPMPREVVLLHTEADKAVKAEAACVGRLRDARTPLLALQEQPGTLTSEQVQLIHTVDATLWDITLDCRSNTLRTRDRLLEALRPEVGAALRQFVERVKQGLSFSFTDSKEGWSRFRQPE